MVRERDGITLTLKGLDELEKKMDLSSKNDISKKMLQAAEPILMGALDAQMSRHPGTLQKSLKSTGAQQAPSGSWYLAYRATTGNEKPGDIPNPQKMIYLTTRQYIKKRKTKNGTIQLSYAIPEDDVIGKAIAASERAVVNAMQAEFENILNDIWEE